MGKHMEKERVHSRGPRPASFSGGRFNRPITPGTRGNTEQLPPPHLSLFSALLLVWLEVAKRPFFLLCLCPSSTCSEWHITKLFDFEQQFFFFLFQWWFMDLIQLCKWPDLATWTSVHDHLFCGGNLFIYFFFSARTGFNCFAIQKYQRIFFFNVYYVFFLDHNFTAAFAFLPSSSSKFVRVQRHFHNIKSIPTNVLSILRKCPALIWLINIKKRRKRVSSFCLSRINEILINLKKISGRVRVLIKILSVFQSLKICKFNNLTLSLPWNQNHDSVVNGLTSLFKNSDGKGY